MEKTTVIGAALIVVVLLILSITRVTYIAMKVKKFEEKLDFIIEEKIKEKDSRVVDTEKIISNNSQDENINKL